MIRAFLAATTTLLAVAPLCAAAQTAPAQEAVVQAFVQFDCIMTDETEDAIVAAMGLSEQEGRSAGGQLFALGLLQEGAEGLILTHPDCPGGDGAPAQSTGLDAAIAWMQGLGAEQAADFMADVITARGCEIGSDESSRYEAEVAAAVAQRFNFDETALLADDMGAFLGALDMMGERGGLQLVQQDRFQQSSGGMRLVDCEAPTDEGAALELSVAEVSERLAAMGQAGVEAVEMATLAEVGCRFPEMMGYNFTAMVFDRMMASLDYDLGPTGALAVMGPAWIGQLYDGPNGDALYYAAGFVNDTVQAMLRDGRLERDGRMLIGSDCVPADGARRDAILPYLTGGQ